MLPVGGLEFAMDSNVSSTIESVANHNAVSGDDDDPTVVIFGSRDLLGGAFDEAFRTRQVDRLVRYASIELGTEFGRVISGGAQGVDSAAREWAETVGVPFKEFGVRSSSDRSWIQELDVDERLFDYEHVGADAYLNRNAVMAEVADVGVALWDGESRGTQHMMSELRSRDADRVVWNTAERGRPPAEPADAKSEDEHRRDVVGPDGSPSMEDQPTNVFVAMEFGQGVDPTSALQRIDTDLRSLIDDAFAHAGIDVREAMNVRTFDGELDPQADWSKGGAHIIKQWLRTNDASSAGAVHEPWEVFAPLLADDSTNAIDPDRDFLLSETEALREACRLVDQINTKRDVGMRHVFQVRDRRIVEWADAVVLPIANESHTYLQGRCERAGVAFVPYMTYNGAGLKPAELAIDELESFTPELEQTVVSSPGNATAQEGRYVSEALKIDGVSITDVFIWAREQGIQVELKWLNTEDRLLEDWQRGQYDSWEEFHETVDRDSVSTKPRQAQAQSGADVALDPEFDTGVRPGAEGDMENPLEDPMLLTATEPAETERNTDGRDLAGGGDGRHRLGGHGPGE